MKSKKMLTLLVVLCLLVSVLSPAAYAVGAGVEAVTGQQSAVSEDAHPLDNDLVVSGEKSNGGLLSLRDEANRPQSQETAQTGSWSARPTQGGSLSSYAKLPADIQELRDAAELYRSDDVVAAFIVMEEQPLAERYNAIARVPAAETKTLVAKQDAVLRTISKEVPASADMEVRYQFTYLTNAISVRVPFGALEEIAAVEGVSSVYLMPVYQPMDTQAAPLTAGSGEMTGVHDVWENLGYTGTGMKIAVIDSGLDLDHPSFAADPATNENSLTQADVAAVLGKLNAARRMRGVTAQDLYYNVKVPFAFNYIDRNLNADHSRDDQGYHGSHVAGIAAANAVEGTDVVGMAPDAQVLVMKVFGVNGGAYADDIIAALEDAMTLDCDVVNMSLGSPAGFSTASPEITAVYSRISKNDMIVNVAAGNEGVSSAKNMWGTDLNRTQHPDNSTMSSPAAYLNTTVVASVDNSTMVSPFFTVNGQRIAYFESNGLNVTFQSLGFDAVEYVPVGGVGKSSDYEDVHVAGKIALVSRGEISFSEKLANAEAAGAIGLVVYNNEPGYIAMAMKDEAGNLAPGVTGNVPAVSVTMASGQVLLNAENKTLVVSPEEGSVASETGGQMSNFSTWGVTPELRLLPDVTGVGGNIYSTIDGGQYGPMSGTSMATPQLAGVSALVLQYVHDQYPDLSDAATRIMADSLIMSTADPVISNVSGVEASPRQQGSGLVNAAEAITAGAYLSVPGNAKPKVELGDDADRLGKYSFSFTIHNFSDADKTYTLDGTLLTEDVLGEVPYAFMAGYDRELEGKVTFNMSSVTVKAGSVASVKATVTLTQADKEWLNHYYENGGYVEGFVYLRSTDENGVDLNLPFLGFFGDWTEPPVLDTGFWYDEMFWNDNYEGAPTAEEYFNIPWTKLANNDWVLGLNPYTGDFENDPDHFVISNNNDGLVDGLNELYFSLMRNARNLTLTFTDVKTGEVYDSRSLSYVGKTMFITNYGSVVPTVYSWFFDSIYDFTDGAGRNLPNNTQVEMSVYANLDFDAHEQNNDFNSWSVPITVDTEAPSLLDVTSTVDPSGSYLTVTASDNTAIAGIQLLNPAGTRILADYSGTQANEDGTYSVTMDITGMGSELLLILGDYGCNESAWELTYTLDDNRPEMDTSKLYAYRNFDASINSDLMFGWVTLDPETAGVKALTSDYLEYYALIAAEYAGGYVFGVEAGGNLVVMVPGLWNRTTIANLNANVLDLTFDKTTNTMYAVTKEDNQFALHTIDLLTGEMTMVKNYGYFGPWSMAADDNGTIYAIQRSSNKLYTVDFENDYKLVQVTDTDGKGVAFSINGRAVSPNYSQSMTYSDGHLYWAYYPGSAFYGAPSIFTVDTETYAYTSVPFASDCEFVGLLTLDNGLADYSCDGESCPSADYVDLDRDAYYHEAVDFVVANDYMHGTSETTFKPVDTMTRGMLVTVLHRMAGTPAPTADNTFPDCNDYYFDAISWAVESGIATGHKDGTFKPNDPVTRAQMVTFLYRYAAYMGCDVVSQHDSLVGFADVAEVDAYALPAMRWAVASGLINGLPGERLAPNANAQRVQVAAVVYRLYQNVTGGWHVPVNQPLSGIVLSDTELLLAADTFARITALPTPWNCKLGALTWTTSDEDVATVENGVITAISGGKATITASVGEISASCEVTVVEIDGTVYAYNYYNGTKNYGDWIRMDLQNLSAGYESMFASPVDFGVAEYNGHEDLIYGYDEAGQFYRFDPKSGDVVALGLPISGLQLVDMAYDYSSGLMYVATVDPSTYMAALNYVNLHTGALVPVGVSSSGSTYMALACSTDGQLYAITADGKLVTLGEASDLYGSGMMMVEEKVVLEGLGMLNYVQSMTYDHDNGNLVWSCTEAANLIWIDPETGSVMPLGDPTGSGLFQFFGLFTIPTVMPELPYVPVEDFTVNDMLVMTGGGKFADFTVYPLNATNQEITWTSADTSVVSISGDGVITGKRVGETQVTATLVDGGSTFVKTFTVTVKESADNLFGFVLTDLATYGGDFWIEMNDKNTGDIQFAGASPYTIFSQEYYNGKLYAFGYDSSDWEANFQFMVMDPRTHAIERMTDMGEVFPWVYDMTYDYSTSTMYATAGYNDTETELYIVDLASGALIPLPKMEENFMSLAADGKGNLYGIDRSVGVYDPFEWTTVFSEASLYRINAEEGTCEVVGSTGLKSNLVASMAFDHDTGNLYWSQLFREEQMAPVTGGLCLVDTETGAATQLGIVGPSGCQVSGIYSIADNYPQEPEMGLRKVVLSENHKSLSIGETAALKAYGLPTAAGSAAEWSWSTSDEKVATVDQQGNVTAVAAGVAEITVTGTFGGESLSAVCNITVLSESACFLTYSTSYYGFSKIDRKDYTHTELLVEDEDNAPVLAMDYVGDTIYGYDMEGKFFSMDDQSFQRTYLGSHGVEVDTDLGLAFDVRDLGYDEVNDRLLALGCVILREDGYEMETVDGCGIYEVNLEDGTLTKLCVLEELAQVRGLTVDDKGVVYIHEGFYGNFRTVDVTTGVATVFSPTYTVSVYGSDQNVRSLDYDPVSQQIYMLYTGNGSFYQMVSCDVNTCATTVLGNIGEVFLDEWMGIYVGETFNGLLVKN